jgi:hypothetical protein
MKYHPVPPTIRSSGMAPGSPSTEIMYIKNATPRKTVISEMSVWTFRAFIMAWSVLGMEEV